MPRRMLSFTSALSLGVVAGTASLVSGWTTCHGQQISTLATVLVDNLRNRVPAAQGASGLCSAVDCHAITANTANTRVSILCDNPNLQDNNKITTTTNKSSKGQEPLIGNHRDNDGFMSAKLFLLYEKMEVYSSSPLKDVEVVKKTVLFLQKKEQEDYIMRIPWSHALGVAHILADMSLDMASVVTGLLHAAIPIDGPAKRALDEIQQQFGKETRLLVQSVADIEKTLGPYHRLQRQGGKQRQPTERQLENYRKLILSLAHDIRVVLVKLADQTQWLRMLDNINNTHDDELYQRQQQVAQETLELYAPLAHRLGMYALKTELEDTCLRYSDPQAYEQLQSMVAARQAQRQHYTNQVIEKLQTLLVQEGGELASATVTGRAKSYYSIYQKMQSQQLAFDDIYDLMAFRILVESVSQCYQVLGLVHSQWRPVNKGRFKDYIASPKPNGYQSLHTTVVGPEQRRIEVQIRTVEMHRVAEGGIAAHWLYKQRGPTSTAKTKDEEAQRYKTLRQLVQGAQQQQTKASESSSSEKCDVTDDQQQFENEVFVFSPQGHLYALAKGATALDFAYCIHSDLGNHCVGAKVNGKMVPLKYKMKNGDTVEILQSNKQTPKNEWLHMVHTSKAQARIRSWIKNQRIGEEYLVQGREILNKAFRKYQTRHPTVAVAAEYKNQMDHLLSTFNLSNEQQLLTALAHGQISIPNVLQEVFGSASSSNSYSNPPWNSNEKKRVVTSIHDATRLPPKTDGIVVGGARNMLISYCRNCTPLYGERVQGVVTRGCGVKVHRIDCRYLLETRPARKVDAVWDEDAASTHKRAIVVEVLFDDAPGMLAEMSKAISSAKINIRTATIKTVSNGRGLGRFELMLSSIDDLRHVTIQLEQEPGVLHVKRR